MKPDDRVGDELTDRPQTDLSLFRVPRRRAAMWGIRRFCSVEFHAGGALGRQHNTMESILI